MDHENKFLEDGYERAYSANEPKVRADVEREFAERLSNASPKERKRRCKEMESENRQAT